MNFSLTKSIIGHGHVSITESCEFDILRYLVIKVFVLRDSGSFTIPLEALPDDLSIKLWARLKIFMLHGYNMAYRKEDMCAFVMGNSYRVYLINDYF